MRIGLTGATGLIGKRIVEMAGAQGHRVTAFSRDAQKSVPGCEETREFTFNGALDLDGLDAVIHLAGENVFGIWTEKKKAHIRQSRVLGTRSVVDGFARAGHPPAVLVSSSAVGFYGDTGEQPVDETSEKGDGFLADVAREWEAEALRAREFGSRVAVVRTGIVLAPEGGALKMMAPPFRFGGGGELGDGLQWMSWIHIDDIARLYLQAVTDTAVEGAINGVVPEPVRNAQFTDHLAQAFQKPALLRVPAWMLRLTLGGFSHELLDSKRVLPRRTCIFGFQHQFERLEHALRDCLERN